MQHLPSKQRVAILGASNKPDRYAHKAQLLLTEHGHQVIPVHPALTDVEGIPCVSSLDKIDSPIDTVTVYVNPTIFEQQTDALLQLAPKRVILNPGTESDVAEEILSNAGITVQRACTLVLLHTGTF
jgi:predicted CoA-binding protein